MIKTEYVEVKVTKKNIDHFILLYKDIKLKDIIKVNPNELQKSSNIFIDVICDICNIERNIKYQAYYKNINSCLEHQIYTCDKCSHIKIKSFNRKKWGVDYFSQTEEYTDKFKSTMIERWGVEYAQQSDSIREKTKSKNLNKFGFENPFMDNEMIKLKFKEKWGVDHPSKVKSIREKAQNTMISRWGYKYSLQIPELKEKIKLSNLNKYGNEHFMKSDNVISKCRTHKDYIRYLNKSTLLFNCENNHEFEIKSDLFHNRIRSFLPLCTICNPLGDSRSIKEKELFEYIRSIYDGEVIQSYRDSLEIDIYLPELKIGFEFNGLYWHSEEYKEKDYHFNKTDFFNKLGIRIIHIWEDDWSLKRDIIKSQIKNWLGLTKEKIWARSCKVIVINKSKISTEFLNKNHIQGSSKSSLKIGLYFNNELVSLMTFDHFEGRSKMEESEWNLSRFCNKLDTTVVGGASKILSYFIKNFNANRIISYADNDWSDGRLYLNLGFNRLRISSPDYKYIINNERVHKSRFRKSRLNTELTESEYMKRSNIKKIWDCGKVKFEMILK